jgi:hypothetical protein
LKKSNKASFGRDEGRENQGQITDSPWWLTLRNLRNVENPQIAWSMEKWFDLGFNSITIANTLRSESGNYGPKYREDLRNGLRYVGVCVCVCVGQRQKQREILCFYYKTL